MKLSVIISVHNQWPLAISCYNETRKNTCGDVEFIIIDNGSNLPIIQQQFPGAKIIRNEQNIGVYPTFKQGFEVATGNVLAFFHSDVVVWEDKWDMGVIEAFDQIPKLGLVGFVGSSEIDFNGGRGGGTASNFQGRVLGQTIDIKQGLPLNWIGSPAEVHGRRIDNYMKSAVVDGCVMIISREAWNKIGYRENFPMHHFYDRLISTQMLEAGFEVGTLGVEFDHISGQTVNVEKGYQVTAYKWLVEKGYLNTDLDPQNPSFQVSFDETHNYDPDIYQIAEKMWLSEYRDTKHIVPIKV
jgi:glycosyltransferase involved in cell wall biosynthesis